MLTASVQPKSRNGSVADPKPGTVLGDPGSALIQFRDVSMSEAVAIIDCFLNGYHVVRPNT